MSHHPQKAPPPHAHAPAPAPASAPAPDSSEPPTALPLPQAHALLTSFSSFLTVAIHNVLYYRGIYPQRTFLSARAFNLPVHQNRHPAVCAWVRDAVDAVKAQLAEGTVARVAVVIHAPPLRPPQSSKAAGKTAGKADGTASSKTGAAANPKGAAGEKGTEKAREKEATAVNLKGKAPVATTAKGTARPQPTAKDDAKGGPKPSPGAVLERWMFDVSSFPAWPGGAEAMATFGTVKEGKGKGQGGQKGESRGSDGDGDGDGESDDEPVEEAADSEDDEDDGNEEEEEDEEDEKDGGDGGDEVDEEDDEGGAEAGSGKGTGTGTGGALGKGDDDKLNWADVNESLRGAVRRLAHAGEKLGSLPEGCTFTVAVELRREALPPIGHPQPWIPSEANLQKPSKTRPGRGRDLGGAKTTPIRSVEAGPLFFECWVEEGKLKQLLRGGDNSFIKPPPPPLPKSIPQKQPS